MDSQTSRENADMFRSWTAFTNEVAPALDTESQYKRPAKVRISRDVQDSHAHCDRRPDLLHAVHLKTQEEFPGNHDKTDIDHPRVSCEHNDGKSANHHVRLNTEERLNEPAEKTS